VIKIAIKQCANPAFNSESLLLLEGCCNSEATQSSYKEIFDKIVDIFNNVIQSYMDMDVDWTEAVLGTLFVAHIAILILFFCSRSLIAATTRE